MEKKDIEQAGKEIVKSGKGNKQAYKNSPFVGNNAIKCTDSEMSEILDRALTVYKWPKIDLDSDEAVEERCALYFEHCRDTGERPTIAGLACAIGCSTQTLSDWESGKTRAQLSSRRSGIIKKAKLLIQYFLEQIAVGNKIYPNVWIFYGKNYFGMKDVQDITITPNTALDQEHTPEEIEAKVLDDIPVDDDNIDTI